MDQNTIAFTGRLTRKPELRHTGSGIAVTTLRVAIGRRKGPEAQDRGAVFVDLEAWRGSAEACARYLDKGSRIAVEGSLEFSQWEKDGATHFRNYVVARPGGITFLGKPEKGEADPAQKAVAKAPARAESDELAYLVETEELAEEA